MLHLKFPLLNFIHIYISGQSRSRIDHAVKGFLHRTLEWTCETVSEGEGSTLPLPRHTARQPAAAHELVTVQEGTGGTAGIKDGGHETAMSSICRSRQLTFTKSALPRKHETLIEHFYNVGRCKNVLCLLGCNQNRRHPARRTAPANTKHLYTFYTTSDQRWADVV